MNGGHEHMAELVASYALDAVEPDEAQLVEDHLRDCPRCRAELADYQDTASLLAQGGEEAPPGVWQHIAERIDAAPTAPPLRVVVGDRGGSSEGRGSRRWIARAAAVAAASALVLLGTGYLHTDHEVSQLRSALSSGQALEQATAAALDPRARRVALTSWNGTVVATAAVLPSGKAYVVPEDLAALPGSRTYQLWSMVGGHPISVGLMGPSPGAMAFRVRPGTAVIAITDEPAGGSLRPTTEPVGSATI